MVHDALSGKSVVIFRSPDAKDDDVDAVSKLVGQSGGAVSGTVSLTQEFVDANSAEKLRSVVNSSILPAGAQLSTKLVDQGSQAGDLLGIALLINRDPAVPTVDDAQRDTVLAALRDTGFIGYGNQHVGAANAAAVVTGGGLGDDAGNQGVSVARFAAALAPHGSGVLLAGRDGSSVGNGGRRGGPRRCGGDVLDQHRRRRERRVRANHRGPGHGQPDQRWPPRSVRHRSRRHRPHCRVVAATTRGSGNRSSRPAGRVSDDAAARMLGWVSVGRQAHKVGNQPKA